MSASCLICDRVDEWKRGQNPYLIHDFDHSIFVVGDHQSLSGVLFSPSQGPRPGTPVARPVQQALFAEVMRAGEVHQFAPSASI